MNLYLEPKGFLGTGASLLADITLLAYVLLLIPGMLAGFYFARRGKHRPHHKYTMATITIVNWILIIFLMVVAFFTDVASGVAEQPENTRFLMPALHALLGAPAQLLATYVIYRMFKEDRDVAAAKKRGETQFSKYWFRNAKRIMRLTLTLWLLTAALGVVSYLIRYEIIPAYRLDGSIAAPVATPEVTPEVLSEVNGPVSTPEMTPEVDAPAETPEIAAPGETPEVRSTDETSAPAETPEIAASDEANAPAETPEIAATEEIMTLAEKPEVIATDDLITVAETPEVVATAEVMTVAETPEVMATEEVAMPAETPEVVSTPEVTPEFTPTDTPTATATRRPLRQTLVIPSVRETPTRRPMNTQRPRDASPTATSTPTPTRTPAS